MDLIACVFREEVHHDRAGKGTQAVTALGAAGSIPPYRAGLFRLLLALAAVYNVAFAAWTFLAPGAFFALLEMEPPRYPAIWQCLGMVVGVYGLGYAYGARRLERAAPFVLLGLVGKVLGPLGWIATVQSGEWPLRTFTLVLFNDLVWWLPFGLFLLEGTALGARLRGAAAPICAAFNFVAAIALATWLRPGTEVAGPAADRLAWIAAHPVAWRAGWGIWMAAALSLVAFYAWWGARIPRRGVAIAAFLLATAGLAADILAESLYAAWLPHRHETVTPLARLLTGAVGNGLYTVAGIVLTAATPGLPRLLRACGWTIWTAGLLLSAFSIAGHAAGMAVATAIVFVLFPPWVFLVGRTLAGRTAAGPVA
jgi:hypothetical protein